MSNDQERIDFIKRQEKVYTPNAARYNREHHEEDAKLISEISKMLRGEIAVDENLFLKLQNYNLYRTAQNFFRDVMYNYMDRSSGKRSFDYWSEKDEFVQVMLKKQVTDTTQRFYWGWQFINFKLLDQDCDAFMDYLLSIGFTAEEIVVRMFGSNRAVLQRNYYNFQTKESKLAETGIYKYIKNKLLIPKIAKTLHELPLQHKNINSRDSILKFLLLHSKETLNNDYDRYLMKSNYQNLKELDASSLQVLITLNAAEQETLIVETIEKNVITAGRRFGWYLMLNEALEGKYHEKVVELGEQGFNFFIQTTPEKYYHYRDGHDPLSYSKYLLKVDKADGKSRIFNYIKDTQMLTTVYLKFLDESFGDESLTYLIEAMMKDSKVVTQTNNGYYESLFKILEKYDVTPHLDRIIEFAVNKANKKTRIQTTHFLGKYIDHITPQALELTKGKKVDQRIVGALILTHSKKDDTKNYLLELVDKEKNDDTRDILLESLHELKFSQPYTYDEVVDMIEKANQRKKLSRWGEKWIEEESLPKLYWQENGEALTPTQIRFLFYRIKRAKGLNSDIEAKQLFKQLDQSKSGNFAIALLKAFQDSNAATKFKYYMTNAGLIGGDAALTKLNTVFKNCITNKRWKLAEYLVGAIAMVGSNKALRIVELISRKYASKRPRIAAAARDAMDAVAIEFNITADQLADRIIPDFGFEDLYKTFEVGDDTYRAFVSKEYKLHYFNQDNKLRKSIPKDTDKELVKELKEIDKEIKAVVKAQQGRLENYLVLERSWAIEEWEKYYRNSPIMLIYVQRLLWGLFKDNKLVTPFYCDEDIELYDVNDEEVELENGDTIKILHPLHLDATELDQWKKKVYDMDIELEFPILNREISEVLEEEKENNFTKVLMGTDIPKGADYVVSFLPRKGWLKESGDGGRLNFYRVCHQPKIKAWANIEGPAAWYQGGNAKATIHEVTFQGENWSDKINLQDVPKIFYSEVIAELKALINAE